MNSGRVNLPNHSFRFTLTILVKNFQKVSTEGVSIIDVLIKLLDILLNIISTLLLRECAVTLAGLVLKEVFFDGLY